MTRTAALALMLGLGMAMGLAQVAAAPGSGADPNQPEYWTQPLKSDALRADIDQLRTAIEQRYAYLGLREYDFRAALSDLTRQAENGLIRREFAIAIQRLMVPFGDPATQVLDRELYLPRGLPPFLMLNCRGASFALRPDRSALLDADHPFVRALDDVATEPWLAAAAHLVPQSHGAYVTLHRIELAHFIEYVRGELNSPGGNPLRLTLGDAASGTATLTMPLDPQPQAFEPLRASGVPRKLTPTLGYVPLPSMTFDAGAWTEFERALGALTDCNGYIIDARGNTGGDALTLGRLLPRFLVRDAAPEVVCVAATRPTPDAARDGANAYLTGLGFRPAGATEWTPAERTAIEKFAAGFKPQWTPASGPLGPWHYLVVSPHPERRFWSQKPIAVLMDGYALGSTEILLGALRDRRNLQLIGQTSGGGVGFPETLTLGQSRLRVSLARVACYRPDGRLYTGAGVPPNIIIDPTLDDVLGTTDTALQTAASRAGG